MPTFPIPVFVGVVLAFAGLRLWQRMGHLHPLVLLLILCAVQSLIIALSQHYGVMAMRLIQPLVASFIPPAAWIAYQGRVSRADLLHVLGPLAAIASLVVAPHFLDVLLPALFVIYGGLILLSAREGADTQPDALFASADQTARIWVFIGVALVASALSDVLIVATQAAGRPEFRPWIISIFSVGNLMVIGALSYSPHLETVVDEAPLSAAAPQIADPEIWARVQSFMDTHKPYLDPDLTLSRLSRKLGIPMKTLSETINRATGENVSRFVNNARIGAAQQAMLEGETVTNAMLMSGFNTKSNFNREFLRVAGINPSAWLTEASVTPR